MPHIQKRESAEIIVLAETYQRQVMVFFLLNDMDMPLLDPE